MSDAARPARDWRIRFVGDAAGALEFEPRIDPGVNARVVAAASRVAAGRHAGVRDVVPSYHAVTVYFDPLRAEAGRVRAALEASASVPASGADAGREVVIPVCYGGAAGPDLDEVAAFAGCPADEVVRRHAATVYRVYMVGYLHGFAYLGTVDPSIAMPRRPTPRLVVPAGSVGIAGGQTGVYPTAAPGGWRLIGRTAVRMFDAGRDPPGLVGPGDRVRFEPMPGPGPTAARAHPLRSRPRGGPPVVRLSQAAAPAVPGRGSAPSRVRRARAPR